MSHQTFYDANWTLAQTLVGVADIEADRIIDRDVSAFQRLVKDDDNQPILKPMLLLHMGDGESALESFPVAPGASSEGIWAVIWQAYLPWDDSPNWIARWEALVGAIKDKLMNPSALLAPTRPLMAHVRWGEEPPIWLEKEAVPNGSELFFTVTQREF